MFLLLHHVLSRGLLVMIKTSLLIACATPAVLASYFFSCSIRAIAAAGARTLSPLMK